MSDPVQSTKLQAVNVLLATIGQAPVSTLIGSGLGHANFAVATINEITRRIQLKEWHFNTEYDYPLTPNASGYLVPPTNTMRVDQMRCHNASVDFVYRDGRMYDKKARTDVITSSEYTFKIILAFDFDKLPEHVRNYITIKSARLFQERILGSETLATFTQDDEVDALTMAMQADLDNADVNILHSIDTYQIINRYI